MQAAAALISHANVHSECYAQDARAAIVCLPTMTLRTSAAVASYWMTCPDSSQFLSVQFLPTRDFVQHFFVTASLFIVHFEDLAFVFGLHDVPLKLVEYHPVLSTVDIRRRNSAIMVDEVTIAPGSWTRCN